MRHYAGGCIWTGSLFCYNMVHNMHKLSRLKLRASGNFRGMLHPSRRKEVVLAVLLSVIISVGLSFVTVTPLMIIATSVVVGLCLTQLTLAHRMISLQKRVRHLEAHMRQRPTKIPPLLTTSPLVHLDSDRFFRKEQTRH